jgi:hypothetical protein
MQGKLLSQIVFIIYVNNFELSFLILMICHHFVGLHAVIDDISNCCIPVRIRVRIDPQHPLVCIKRQLKGEVLQMRPEQPRSHVTALSRCGTIKIPPCSKALSTKHRLKFCSPSPVVVTSLHTSEKFLSGT